MSDNSLEDMFTSALMKESANKLQDAVNDKLNELEKQLISRVDRLDKRLQEKVDLFEEQLSNTPMSVNLGTIEKPKNKLVHNAFDTIIKTLQSANRINKNIMLVGPAGSSKSTTCAQIAEALKLDFYFMSVGLQTTKSDLIGFINAKGDYITTPVRQAFENGGVLLLDEFDATHSGVITILNSMLANDTCSFPDKIIKKHKNFVCIVACNTYGKGGSIDYIGRNRLDGATLDRFVVINMDYDDRLEEKLTNNKHWIKAIRTMRDNIRKQGLKVIISPRASMQGADLLDAGFKIEDVLEMVIYKGASNDVRKKITSGIDFGVFNKPLQDKEDLPKSNTTNDKPIVVTLDFDTLQYGVSNIVENTSIMADIDWEGNFSIYISSQSDWDEGLFANELFLNFGKIRPLPCLKKDYIYKFITQLETYYTTIKTENQQILFNILLEGQHSYFKVG